MRKSWMVFISVGMLSLISFTGCSDTKMPTQEENSISSMRESDLAVQERKEDIEENILVETPETEDIPVEPEPAVLLYQHLDFPAVSWGCGRVFYPLLPGRGFAGLLGEPGGVPLEAAGDVYVVAWAGGHEALGVAPKADIKT